MVTRRVAEVLLRAAARRRPAELRDDLRREWSAELHVLAEGGARLRMLRFAGSLAVSRSGVPVFDRSRLDGRVRRTAATLLLAPLACLAILPVAVALTAVVSLALSAVNWPWLTPLQVLTALTAGLAVPLARYAGHSATNTALTGPVRTALGLVLPVGVTVVLAWYAVNPGADDLIRAAPGLVVWLTGLVLVLWGAGALAGRGQVRAAWALGVLGALVAADLAVVLTVVNHVPSGPGTILDGVPQDDTVDRISAPLWLFASLTDSSFGLPRPTPPEIFLITHVLELQPFLYLACTPYALAYAIGAARSATPPPVEVTPAEPTPWPA